MDALDAIDVLDPRGRGPTGIRYRRDYTEKILSARARARSTSIAEGLKPNSRGAPAS